MTNNFDWLDRQLILAEHNGLLRLSRSKAANHRCLGRLWNLCSLDQFRSSWLRLLRTRVRLTSLMAPWHECHHFTLPFTVLFCAFAFQLIKAALNEGETPSLISDETIILEPGTPLSYCQTGRRLEDKEGAWAVRASEFNLCRREIKETAEVVITDWDRGVKGAV